MRGLWSPRRMSRWTAEASREENARRHRDPGGGGRGPLRSFFPIANRMITSPGHGPAFRPPVAAASMILVNSCDITAPVDQDHERAAETGKIFTRTMIGYPFAELVSYLWRSTTGVLYVR